MSNMESDMIIINVVAKKSSKTIELSVPDDVFNQAERIFLKNERGVFYKTFPAEAFGSDAWRNTKDGNPEVDPKSGWSDDVLVVDKDPDADTKQSPHITKNRIFGQIRMEIFFLT